MKTGSWSAPPSGGASDKILSRTLGIEQITARLLINRGFTTPSECLDFFSPSLEGLHDPFCMKDMQKAAGVVTDALKSGKKITVYGDFDVDGITASAILVRSLREEGADVEPYVPHRILEGYGLNENAVKEAAGRGAGLIITADCGINSIKEVILARRLGIDVVVTDHHEQDSIALPPASAVLNPRQSGCRYPFKLLSGAGVALKLAAALFGEQKAIRHLDLAALGTVADSVPLTGENRVIVKLGLDALAGTQKPGLLSLMEITGAVKRKMTVRDIAFILGPRLNAPGRMESADASMELLITEDPAAARAHADTLEKNNTNRRERQKKMFESAEGKLKDFTGDPVIALHDENWHPGLIGIIASKLSERYSRPAILISSNSADCRGSARCGENFHMLSALNGCRRLLKSLGGHSRAAGFSISRRNIPRFIRTIKTSGHEAPPCLPGAAPPAELEAAFSEITMKLLGELAKFQPCGQGNPEPLFSASKVKFEGIRRLKNGHLKMRARQGGFSFDCIGFGMYEESLGSAGSGGLLFSPEINLWGGKKEIQLVLKGIKTDSDS